LKVKYWDLEVFLCVKDVFFRWSKITGVCRDGVGSWINHPWFVHGVDHFESNLTVQHFVPSQVFEYYDGNL